MYATFRSGLLISTLLLVLQVVSGAQPAANPKGDKMAAKEAKDYEVRTVRVGETFQSVRFKPTTGEAWQLNVDTWQRMPESDKLAPGVYDVMLFTTEKDFYGMRLERTTGATWFLKGGAWVKIKEPPPDPKAKQGAMNLGPHDLRQTRIDTSVYVVRFNTRTGESFVIERDTFQLLAETEQPPAGDYDMAMVATEVKGQWMAIRNDRKSGTTWLLKQRQWTKVGEPKEK